METTQQHKLQNTGQILLYQTDDGKVTVDVSFENETFWMTQKAIAELFDVNVPAISKHLKNIFESGELLESSVISKMEITASDGKNYLISFYNLDAIIAVGYRVNSKRATKFRQWATNTLKDYIIKGFVINDELLKNGKKFGKDYFDELLERIREIRESERRAYHKITTMREWLDRTNEFLKFAEQPILNSAGRISHEQALKKAMEEYEIFRKKQDQEYFSHFDSVLEKYLKGKD